MLVLVLAGAVLVLVLAMVLLRRRWTFGAGDRGLLLRRSSTGSLENATSSVAAIPNLFSRLCCPAAPAASPGSPALLPLRRSLLALV